MECKGILTIENESEIFENSLKEDIPKLGVKLDFEWEVDEIIVSMYDKNDNYIGSMSFENNDFQRAVEDVMPPTMEEINNQEPPKQEQIDEALLEEKASTLKERILELHK